MFAKLLHLVVGLLGVLLLYVALFLTETAEGRIQNRLEALWVTVDDLSKVALTRQAAFLQQVSHLLGAFFDKLFGKKLFSAKAVASSICFSSAAPLFLVSLTVLLYSSTPAVLPGVLGLLGAVVLLIVGLAPVPIRYLGFLWIVVLFTVIFYINRDWFKWQIGLIASEVLFLLAVLLGGFTSDILFIIVSRWYFRKIENMSSAWKIVALLIFNAIVGLLLVSPLLWCLLAPGRMTDTKSVVGFIGASNLTDAVVPLLFVLLSLMAIAHLIIWPVLQGPIYWAQRYGVVRQPKLLASLAVICLSSAWPTNPLVHLMARFIRS